MAGSAPAPLRAQTPDSAAAARPWITPLPGIGSEAEDRLRTAQLLGRAPSEGFLVRSPSTMAGSSRSGAGGAEWAVLSPEVTTTWNSGLPFSMNDGPAWAGRGGTVQALAGVRVRYSRLSLVLAPQVAYSQNREFSHDTPEVPLYPTPGRSEFSLPWYTGPHSADLPVRFGRRGFTTVGLGQSTLSADVGPLAAGVSTENQWWGPGIRNSLVMSNNAPGIPHLFLRTGRSLRTRLGAFEGKWMLGELSESAYFDTVTANDPRSISGLAATFRPAWDPTLTVGAARTVYASVRNRGAIPGRGADALFRWGSPGRDYEQVTSFFGRWVFPGDGMEVYGEWARRELPSSPGDFARRPGHAQGYTVGIQWAGELAREGALRVQTELTYLEQTPRTNGVGFDTFPSFYTSARVPQGYTHHGQSVGAAIGPGSSSQWVAADYLAPGWRLGIFGGRIRWDNDAFYSTARARIRGWPFLAHDVSVFGGVRGSYSFPGLLVTADLQTGVRYNFLFQNRGQSWETADDAEDVRNHMLRFTVTPFTRPEPR